VLASGFQTMPQRLKPRFLALFAARLKSCPFKTLIPRTTTEFVAFQTSDPLRHD
jgi:hypothetical protein